MVDCLTPKMAAIETKVCSLVAFFWNGGNVPFCFHFDRSPVLGFSISLALRILLLLY